MRKTNKLERRNTLKQQLLQEEVVINKVLQTSLARERYVEINTGITTKSEYLDYERFLEHRTVWL
jgi:malate synthase